MRSSFEEFISLWNRDILSKRKFQKKSLGHLLFLITYPDNLEWDFSVEKQTQMTTLLLSGGPTGAGTGHYLKFCRQSKVNDFLKEETNCSHAMICSVGWIADMTKYPTPIMNFIEFSKSDMYCKAHIIARPDKNAHLHHQHIELNLIKWRELGCPNVYGKWSNYTRAQDNFHDDYTPSWIIPEGLPKIDNFTRMERGKKAFSYSHRDYNEEWKDLNKVDYNNPYFSKIMERLKSSYYVYNTESYKELPKEKFDLYLSPSSGYLTEEYCYNNKYKGDIVFYDFVQKNLDIKRKIIEMNMSFDEIKKFDKIVRAENKKEDYGMNRQMTPWNGVQLKTSISQIFYRQYKIHKELQKKQEYMFNNCNIEYWLTDLINPDYNKIIEKVRGKTVFINITNIFGYHISHTYYTLDELFDSFFELINALQYADRCWLIGTTPTKQRVQVWL